MLAVAVGIIARILSNSYINVFQKILTSKGAQSSVINFYTYFGLVLICLFCVPVHNINLSGSLIINFTVMGLLGALGNYFIIKALSLGELSSLAPINSFKPIVALLIAIFYLGEVPNFIAILGILLIICGTLLLYNITHFPKEAVFYRALALLCSGSEAVFIKKIILLTNVEQSLFLWALSGMIFALLFVLISRHKLNLVSFKHQGILILLVTIMQYSTNFVFTKLNVSYALALFQLSTLLSVFLGAEIFNEKNLKQKIIASIVMVVGAIVLILT